MKTLVTVLSLFLLAAPFVSAESREEKAQKLIKQLDASEPRDRAKAAEEIGKLAEIKVSLGKPAVPKLITLLEDKDTNVRAAAAGAVCRCDDKSAVDPIVKMLKDEKETKVILQAVMGLGIMGESAREALPTIREIAQKNREEKDKRVLIACRNAMEEISGRTPGKKK
jgi:HEAT repeat protein